MRAALQLPVESWNKWAEAGAVAQRHNATISAGFLGVSVKH